VWRWCFREASPARRSSPRPSRPHRSGRARSSPRGSPDAGKSLSDIAVANGKTRDGLIAALVAAEQQSLSTFVDQKGGPRGDPKGDHGERHVIGDLDGVAATYLGTTTADLEIKTDAGQSLAAIANATAGKSRDGLIQALVADATTKIELAKTNGSITAAQATALESTLTARITAHVDKVEVPGH